MNLISAVHLMFRVGWGNGKDHVIKTIRQKKRKKIFKSVYVKIKMLIWGNTFKYYIFIDRDTYMENIRWGWWMINCIQSGTQKYQWLIIWGSLDNGA